MRDDLERFLKSALESPREQLPRALAELEEVRYTLLAQLTAPAQIQSSGPDELIGVEEAARRLGCSEHYLYTHKEKYGFVRRIGRKVLFSALGVERYINQKDSVSTTRRGGSLVSIQNATAERKSH